MVVEVPVEEAAVAAAAGEGETLIMTEGMTALTDMMTMTIGIGKK